MVAIFSIAMANVLVLLRVLVLWQDDKVCPAYSFKFSKLGSSNIFQENRPVSLGRVFLEFPRNDLYDALDLCHGPS